MSEEALRFGFGRNWQSFVNRATDQRRVAWAVASLQRLLMETSLAGKSFLDIGCGSGLSSLAACRLGAERVIAFDYDPESVRASEWLRERSGISSDRWSITTGSILDQESLRTLPPCDVVYSWGVLHHTGSMWQAIDNAATLVKPGGLLAIAIYNRVESRLGGSAFWWRVKRAYNQSPAVGQRLIELAYLGYFTGRQVAALRDPIAAIRQYDEGGRGMSFWHDLRDWVGGFPYEYATAGELFEHLHGKHGFQVRYLNTVNGIGCNELTFWRPAD